jgi:hypothetical protein
MRRGCHHRTLSPFYVFKSLSLLRCLNLATLKSTKILSLYICVLSYIHRSLICTYRFTYASEAGLPDGIFFYQKLQTLYFTVGLLSFFFVL